MAIPCRHPDFPRTGGRLCPPMQALSIKPYRQTPLSAHAGTPIFPHAPPTVIARSEATWQSRAGTPTSPVPTDAPVRPCRHPHIPARIPPSVIARSEATWQSRAGTPYPIRTPNRTHSGKRPCPPMQAPPYSRTHPPSVIARSEATWQSRAGTPYSAMHPR